MPRPDRDSVRAVAVAAAQLLVVGLIGALVGMAVAVLTPARLEIAGSDTRVWLEPGVAQDRFGIDRVLTGTRATSRGVLGEPIGVHVAVDLDASALTDANGEFDTNVLPAYVQAFSDPEQLVADIRGALIVHYVVWLAIGAGAAALVDGARRWYRWWRDRYDRVRWPGGRARRIAVAYRAPERRFARRTVAVVALVAVVATIPAARFRPPAQSPVVGEAIFDGTPLAGIEVGGLLRPALLAAQSYVRTYFEQTDSYYDEVRTLLDDHLTEQGVALPSEGDDTVHLGFVTDRHCNIGMDRVIVALLQHYDIHTLVSAGDDAFSGSFSFESACTRNLADKTRDADIHDVFVGGNHDSAVTIADEADQGITTLTGDVETVDGLHFVGSPDPRTSRYGQGIVPSDQDAQNRLLVAQGRGVGRTACASTAPIIAVLHDPLAGRTAIGSGCGRITLALDGHTHRQGTPVRVGDGVQFTGGSAGGAPTEEQVENSFAARLTVGPLNHQAWLNIVSLHKDTGALIGVTAFHILPDMTITVSQQPAPS